MCEIACVCVWSLPVKLTENEGGDHVQSRTADDRLMSVGEVARHFGVHVATVRRWDADGILVPTSRTLGGQRRYRRQDVLDAQPATDQ